MGQRKGLLMPILYAIQFSDVLYHLQFYRLKQQLNDGYNLLCSDIYFINHIYEVFFSFYDLPLIIPSLKYEKQNR
jgi:hypothetical protein